MSSSPSRPRPLTGGTVALLVGPDLWSAVDHGIEVTWQLAREMPDRRLRWLAGGEDAWLARHDLGHAGLIDVVEIVDPHDDRALDDVAVVVRTGYSSETTPLLSEAHAAGLPVAAFGRADRPSDATELEPFDVEGLVDEVRSLLDRAPS